MAKKLFFAPMLTSVGDNTDITIRPSGGLIAQSFDAPTEVTVTLPDGSAIVADEFGNVLDAIVEENEVIEEVDVLE